MAKVAVITGANTGIGFATARELARQGVTVCLACRNRHKARLARNELLEEFPNATIQIYTLDLAAFDSIQACADELLEHHPRIDILINNAGAAPLTQQATEEGFELQFGANYLGHFLLTHRLLPGLINSATETGDARVIHVASIAHMLGSLREKNFKGYRLYNPAKAYANSKLCNLMFNFALARRLPSGIVSLAYHPGSVDSEIWRELPKLAYAGLKPILISPQRAGEMGADLALNPQHTHRNGEYFTVQWPRPVSRLARSKSRQDWLYDISCRLAQVGPLAARRSNAA